MTQRFDYGKTHEERKLALIKFVDENPYKITVRRAASRFHLMEEDVFKLWDLLALELEDKLYKNKIKTVEKIMEYNENLTADEIMHMANAKKFVVYSVATRVGYSFGTKYLKKAEKRKKIYEQLLTIQ